MRHWTRTRRVVGGDEPETIRGDGGTAGRLAPQLFGPRCAPYSATLTRPRRCRLRRSTRSGAPLNSRSCGLPAHRSLTSEVAGSPASRRLGPGRMRGCSRRLRHRRQRRPAGRGSLGRRSASATSELSCGVYSFGSAEPTSSGQRNCRGFRSDPASDESNHPRSRGGSYFVTGSLAARRQKRSCSSLCRETSCRSRPRPRCC